MIDSGILSTFLTLGLFGGLIYFGVLLALSLALLRGAAANRDSVTCACAAIVLARLAELPLGSHHVAEHGMFLWVFLGLGLARATSQIGNMSHV